MPLAEVAFTSQAETKQTFFGVATVDGTYQLDLTGTDGVPPGSYNVSVAVWTLKDGSPLPTGEEGEVLKSDGSAVQETRTFVKEVTPGANQIDLALEDGDVVAAHP